QRGLLLARTDPSVPKHAGITAFALDMHAPGVTVSPLRQMNGDTHFSEVHFDGAPVADADRIDTPGEGWRVARTALTYERGAGAVGGGGGWSADLKDRLVDLVRRQGATDAIQRNIVGERVLGLPSEPRADVDVPVSELPRTVRRAEQ